MGDVVYEVLLSEAALNFYLLYKEAQTAFVCLFRCSLMHGGAEIFQKRVPKNANLHNLLGKVDCGMGTKGV